MDYLNLIAVVWVAFFALIGFFKGLWKSVAGLLGVVGAFLATALFAEPVSQMVMQRWEFEHGQALTWGVSAAALFVVSGIVIRVVVMALLKALPVKNLFLNRIGGATFSVLYGGLLGLFLVWGLSFVHENLALAKGEAVDHSDSAIVSLARKFVGRLAGWNAAHGGASPETVKLTVAMAENPSRLLNSLQGTLASREFQELLADEEVRTLVRRGDTAALKTHREFEDWLESPEMERFNQVLAQSDIEWNADDLAGATAQIWARVETLKNNPELRELLNDREIRAFLEGEGAVSPDLMKKAQRVLGVKE